MTMDYAEYQALRRFGGRPIAKRGKFADSPDDTVEWNFGVLRPSHPGGYELTEDYERTAAKLLKAIKTFKHTITVNDDVDHIDLTKTWGHPRVVEALGKPFVGFGQQTGSCVGAGGGNAQATMAFLEVILKGEAEKPYIPWWPLMYGRSRFYMGDRSRGEGSLESAWAEGIKDGVLPAATSGLPQFTEEGGLLHCGSSVELAWSDGDSPPLTNYLDPGRRFPIQKAFRIRNADEAWDPIGELKVIGHGAMDGYNVTGKTPDGEFMGKRGPRWSHKETILGRRTISGKRYFKNVNQWPYQGAVHVWIPEEDVDWIAQDEMFAYEGLTGIPDDQLRWVDWTQLPE